jgi:GAF domain
LQQEAATRTSQANISAALAVATATASARIPLEGTGGSLADMAQRDLDAALQLLADRAQYITGSTGAAIALRRRGKNDMLCRATAGSNAPELGALLSTEFGLSGESVRTRQLLRCDDIERDARVNREACRQLGIASVAVMPVVNDDEVLGVFELFSGKVNAFGERDLTALKRLSEMVETAVKLARVAELLPEQLLQGGSAAAETTKIAAGNPAVDCENDDHILEVDAEFVADAVLPEAAPVVEPVETQPSAPAIAKELAEQLSPDPPKAVTITEKPSEPAPAVNRPLLWSMALDSPNSAASQADPTQVPATLRNLRKCQACGFPVSPGRALCVECEEKKWRGQLKGTSPARPSATSSVVAAAAPARAAQASVAECPPVPTPKSSEPVFPATRPINQVPDGQAAATAATLKPQAENHAKTQSPKSQPELVLTAAMEPSQSWIAAHKFVLLTLLGIGAGAAIVWLR